MIESQQNGEELSPIQQWIEFVSLGIEILAIAIIVVAIVYGTGRYLLEATRRPPQAEAYDHYKVRLGKSLLLGLEILVAADVVRTVALEPSIESVTILGILVVIRTFLSWSLVVEIEDRWPWQSRAGSKERFPDDKI